MRIQFKIILSLVVVTAACSDDVHTTGFDVGEKATDTALPDLRPGDAGLDMGDVATIVDSAHDAGVDADTAEDATLDMGPSRPPGCEFEGLPPECTPENTTNIFSPGAMQGIRCFDGHLAVGGPSEGGPDWLEDLSGLKHISGLLEIGYSFPEMDDIVDDPDANPGLVSLSGLRSLETVWILGIKNNQDLASLQGLENLRCSESIRIAGNPELKDASALRNMEWIGELEAIDRNHPDFDHSIYCTLLEIGTENVDRFFVSGSTEPCDAGG